MNVTHLHPKARPAAVEFMIADWKQTLRHMRYAFKFVREYFYFRQRGFPVRASIWNARNTI